MKRSWNWLAGEKGGRAKATKNGTKDQKNVGWSAVNTFLTLAATRHKIHTQELREKPRVQEILNTAKEGKVPAYLVSTFLIPTSLLPTLLPTKAHTTFRAYATRP